VWLLLLLLLLLLLKRILYVLEFVFYILLSYGVYIDWVNYLIAACCVHVCGMSRCVLERERREPGCTMCCLERTFGCICLNTDVIVCFVGVQFAEHLRFPIFTLRFRRILLKRHFGGKNANSDNVIFYFRK
jgi:hypothetical protein